MEFHPFMGCLETESFVKSPGVGTAFIGGELHQVTTTLPGAINCPLHGRAPYAFVPLIGPHMYRFDLCTEASLESEELQETQMKSADHFTLVIFDHDYLLVVLRLYYIKGPVIGVWQWILQRFASLANVVFGDQPYNHR